MKNTLELNEFQTERQTVWLPIHIAFTNIFLWKEVWRSISAKNHSCHSTFNFMHQHLSWVQYFQHHGIKPLSLHINNWFHTSQHCSSQMSMFNLEEPNTEYSKFLYWSHSSQIATSQFTNINLRPPTSPRLTLNSANKVTTTSESVLQR